MLQSVINNICVGHLEVALYYIEGRQISRSGQSLITLDVKV